MKYKCSICKQIGHNSRNCTSNNTDITNIIISKLSKKDKNKLLLDHILNKANKKKTITTNLNKANNKANNKDSNKANKKKRRICSICKQVGHNSRTCTINITTNTTINIKEPIIIEDINTDINKLKYYIKPELSLIYHKKIFVYDEFNWKSLQYGDIIYYWGKDSMTYSRPFLRAHLGWKHKYIIIEGRTRNGHMVWPNHKIKPQSIIKVVRVNK